MQVLAQYIMRGPMQAILVTSVFAMVSMLQPPLTWLLAYISGAAIALVTLQVGMRQGLMVTAGAALGSGLMALLVLGTPVVAVIFVLILWMPVWLVAAVLTYTRSLALALKFAGGVGVVVVALVFMMVGDPVLMWQEVLSQIKPVLAQAYKLDNDAQLQQLLDLTARVMTGAAAGYLVIGLVVSLFIGRAWQAMLFRPGAFGDEFNQLRFDKVTGLVMVAVVTMATLGNMNFALNITIVFGAAYMFYGLGVVHGIVKSRGGSARWLAALYVLMVIAPPQVMMILALLGLVDTWVDFRSRFGLNDRHP
jgi:hypothetical protein